MRAPRRRGRTGFSLVELLVALLLVDIALLALVGVGALVRRELAVVAARATALSVARARLERLASMSCAAAPQQGESTPAPGLHEWWSATPGRGDTRSLLDSIELTTVRGPRTITLRSANAC